MRAIAVVVVAVASLLGLGWYFANSQVSVANKPSPISKPSQAALLTKPVLDQAALQKQNEKIDFQSGGQAHSSHAIAKPAQDFEMPADENEVVGKYVHRQMVHPKAPSAAKHVPMDDDLLVMEGRSEDRLSATR